MNEHIVDAHILPLRDKHYGTDISLVLDNGERTQINIWIPFGVPSNDELRKWGTDRAGWEANIEVEDCWAGTIGIQSVLPCDTHYQSQYEQEVCEQIVNALKEARRGE